MRDKKNKLSILFGNNMREEVIYLPSSYFNKVYEEDWMQDPVVIEMIHTIDKNTVIDVNIMRPGQEKMSFHGIISPVHGLMRFKDISGGTKACILMYKTDKIINVSGCDDNCMPIIEKILEYKDVLIHLDNWKEFPEGGYPITVINSGKTVYTRDELYREYVNWISSAEEYMRVGAIYTDDILKLLSVDENE